MSRVIKSERMKLYPLKKALLALLWLFCVTVGIKGALEVQDLYHRKDYFTILIAISFALTSVFSFSKIKKYIQTPLLCVPYMGAFVNKNTLLDLIDQESFADLAQSVTPEWNSIEASRNWLCIKNRYVCKHLILRRWLEYNHGGVTVSSMEAKFLLLTGHLVSIKVSSANSQKYDKCLESFIKENTFAGREMDRLLCDDDLLKIQEALKKYIKTYLELHNDFAELLKENDLQILLLNYMEKSQRSGKPLEYYINFSDSGSSSSVPAYTDKKRKDSV